MSGMTYTKQFIILWFFVGISIFLVVARLAVRTWKGLWRFWLSEVWLALSVISFTILVGGAQYIWSKSLPDWGVKTNVGENKWKFYFTFICEVGYYFPRFSLLAFYYELFPITEERLRKALYAVTIFSALAFVVDAFVITFWCGLPVSKNWSTNDNDCTVYMTEKVFQVTWPIGIVSELLIFILPFGMLRRLTKTPIRERIALLGLFSLGIITIVMTTLRFVYTMQSIYTIDTTIISAAEIVSQIVVCALPALRPVLPIISSGWARLSSIVTGKDLNSEDERRLQGSYNSNEKGSNRMNEGNLAEIGEWHSEEGNSASLAEYQSQPADDRRS